MLNIDTVHQKYPHTTHTRTHTHTKTYCFIPNIANGCTFFLTKQRQKKTYLRWHATHTYAN